MNFVENDQFVKTFSSELHRKHRSLTNVHHMVDQVNLTCILISCTSVIITIRKKVEFVITFKTLFEFIFLIDQYWERVIFIGKGYPGPKIFLNIHENFKKLKESIQRNSYRTKQTSFRQNISHLQYVQYRTVLLCTIFVTQTIVLFLFY